MGVMGQRVNSRLAGAAVRDPVLHKEAGKVPRWVEGGGDGIFSSMNFCEAFSSVTYKSIVFETHQGVLSKD